jgi:hypothetical protein
MAITCGAVLLALSFWMEEKAERALKVDSEASDHRPTPEEAPS